MVPGTCFGPKNERNASLETPNSRIYFCVLHVPSLSSLATRSFSAASREQSSSLMSTFNDFCMTCDGWVTRVVTMVIYAI